MRATLRQYIFWSIGIHCVVLVLFSLNLFGTHSRPRKDDVVMVTLPKGTNNQFGSSVKKSQGLPKVTVEEMKKAMESPPSGEKKAAMTYQEKTPKKPDTKKPKVPDRPGHKDSAIDDALRRMQQAAAAKKNVQPEAAQIPDAAPGGFDVGSDHASGVMPNDPEYVLYQARITKKIMDQWIIPLKYTETNSGLICKIVVHMNEKGEVTTTEWEQKSGDPVFDASAERAIEKAQPLDTPPERLKEEVYNDGFIVEFKPTRRQ